MLTVVAGCAAKSTPQGPTSAVPTAPTSAAVEPDDLECVEALLPPKRRKAAARGWFKRGMRALQEGEFADGIESLKHAHCVLPHRNVLFNIARAYAEWGDLKAAVRYLREYLATHPPDAAEAQALLDSLERRLEELKRRPYGY